MMVFIKLKIISERFLYLMVLNCLINFASMKFLFKILNVIFFKTFFHFLLVSGKHERRLLFKIFKEQGYNPLERPVENETESLEVVVGMALSVLINNKKT